VTTLHRDTVSAFDGTPLAVHRLGQGRAVLMLHGLFSSARMNWIRFGHAQAVADAGFEVVMPDLRAHGESGAPHDPGAYPADVLVRDLNTIIAALGLDDFDLVGFSLGARTAISAVVGGSAPRKLVLAGMGLEGLSGWSRRSLFFIDAIDRFDEIEPGDAAFLAVQFMKTMHVDRTAARLLLHSVGDIELGTLARLTMPTLVVCGQKDLDNGPPGALAAALPNAKLAMIPGTHMSSVTESALSGEIVRFLRET
jgi:pimeloyl-ACP methyl ester carboxylesterase